MILRRKGNKGVTLIELMIALVIAAVLVAGTYSIFISQQRTYISQDQIVAAQQDGRAALTIMARDIRMAGMLTGVNGFSVWDGSTNATEAITPTNSTTGPDQIRVVYAAEEFISGANPVTVTSVASQTVTLQSLSTFDAGSFFDTGNNKYVAFEGNTGVYQVAAGTVGNTLNLTSAPPSFIGNFMARVFRVRAITYSVNTSSYTLQRNDGVSVQTLAGATNQSQVEDLQIAYQVSGSNSWIYDTTADTWPASNTNADIRVVKIDLLMRTPVEDTRDQNYSRQGLEDHAGSTTNDGFRRRLYTMVVKLRNF